MYNNCIVFLKEVYTGRTIIVYRSMYNDKSIGTGLEMWNNWAYICTVIVSLPKSVPCTYVYNKKWNQTHCYFSFLIIKLDNIYNIYTYIHECNYLSFYHLLMLLSATFQTNEIILLRTRFLQSIHRCFCVIIYGTVLIFQVLPIMLTSGTILHIKLQKHLP